MNIKTIQKGDILVARPSLMGDVFSRSVILITDHSQQNGSVGFVLNKSLELPLSQFISELNPDWTVYEGGPVEQENIFYLHTRPDLIGNSEKIKNDLFWSGNYDDVIYAINNGLIDKSEIRFYLGYSGWAVNQLQEELSRNSWTVVRDNSINIFADWSNNLWKRQMKKLGGENLLWMNMPDNPILN